MITIIQRRFLPNKLKVSSWDVLSPYFNQLLERKISSKMDLENWLKEYKKRNEVSN